MLPDDTLSLTPVPGAYLSVDDQRSAYLVDQEMGGIAISDPSAGLTYQPWTLSYSEIGEFVLTPHVTGTPTVLLIRAGVSDLALAFDQNMRPAVAYTQNGSLYLWWYDTVVAGYVISNFGQGLSPRLALDDKRVTAEGASDILFAYIQDGQIKYRQQRDRFTVERVLSNHVYPNTRIRAFGMTEQLRIQIELVEP